MKVVIVFNHPYEGSYCTAILTAVMAGLKTAQHEVDLIHLDKEGFNPVMTTADLLAFKNRQPVDPKVIEYKQRLEHADHLIFIFPIWWELMPALTKGFIDRVIFPGVAYDYTPSGYGMKPLLKNIKGITVITTMNTPGFLYRLVFGNAVRKAVITGTFWKMRYPNRKWINLSGVKQASGKKRNKWLRKLEQQYALL
ncbi:NAD(P)H-dependent oxidoreductase [Niabella beijingensis]|uniref:NAD(P)H-dependent oxidoreductase n=1 Tax=Niabella beijingensis TaxID=2872700 RepID=UPI001CBE2298|nr:NAD(P)H-dependent oxidoreductase [Niabella beijingensis]MBZ4188428.1 NAD(P)H-dependent oxidoreductase [Niabella beijingensis]